MNFDKLIHSPLLNYLKWQFKGGFYKNKNHYDYCINYYDRDSNQVTGDIWKEIDNDPQSLIHFENQLVGVKYWIEGKYKIVKETVYFDMFPVLNIEDRLYYISRNSLYEKSSNGIRKLLGDVNTCGPYNEMIEKNGYYALRTGGKIYVSCNLTKWDCIYDDKRGIKHSMVLINKPGEMSLLFIEYTTGFQSQNHRILEYNFNTNKLSVKKTFLNKTTTEYRPDTDFARHIHVIQQDPYTGYIYVGTGDFDYEPGIYFSKDFGDTFDKVGGGTPMYRSLSFFFTEDYIFWNTDTPEKQFIYRKHKHTGEIKSFPVINSALWCFTETSFNGKQFFIMSSNSEGAWFDNNNRIYGIIFSDDRPQIYELLSRKSRDEYDQLFPCCATGGSIYFYNILYRWVERYRFQKIE